MIQLTSGAAAKRQVEADPASSAAHHASGLERPGIGVPVLAPYLLGGMLVLLPLAAIGYERRGARRRAAAAYREAAAIGLETTRVEREIPFFERGNTRVRFVPGSCARSAVPLRRVAGPMRWSLKVTDRHGGMAGDGWWHLREDEGDLPPAVVLRLTRELSRLEGDGGFLEFAGSDHEVVAWWDEGSGADEARRIAEALRDVAHLLEQEGVGARSRLRA